MLASDVTKPQQLSVYWDTEGHVRDWDVEFLRALVQLRVKSTIVIGAFYAASRPEFIEQD
jgi:hypothetical protein